MYQAGPSMTVAIDRLPNILISVSYFPEVPEAYLHNICFPNFNRPGNSVDVALVTRSYYFCVVLALRANEILASRT